MTIKDDFGSERTRNFILPTCSMLAGEINSDALAAAETDMTAANIKAAMEFLLMKFLINLFL
jgi:hypothetical protein